MAERSFKEIKKLRELSEAELKKASGGGWEVSSVTNMAPQSRDSIKDIGAVTDMGGFGRDVIK